MLAPRSTSVVVVQEEARMLAARSFTLLVPAYLGSPGKGPVKRGCVCVRVCCRPTSTDPD